MTVATALDLIGTRSRSAPAMEPRHPPREFELSLKLPFPGYPVRFPLPPYRSLPPVQSQIPIAADSADRTPLPAYRGWPFGGLRPEFRIAPGLDQRGIVVRGVGAREFARVHFLEAICLLRR